MKYKQSYILPIMAALLAFLLSGCDPAMDAITSSRSIEDNLVTDRINRPENAMLKSLPDVAQLTESYLHSFEKERSLKLPSEYREFVLDHNGGFPSPNCVIFEEDGRRTASDVLCFFALNDERSWASVEWHLEILADRLPESTLPIARDAHGNLWLLSLRKEDTGAVYFWELGSYANVQETKLAIWPKVANNFQAFRQQLTTYDQFAEPGDIPSRYALTKQATAAMTQRDEGFSLQATPEFVWHCDCNAEGKVQMEFVQYQMHAGVTHTCGYARLRAIQNLIEEGEARLPQ